MGTANGHHPRRQNQGQGNMAGAQQHQTAIRDVRDCTLAQLFGEDNDKLFTEKRLKGIFGETTKHQQIILSVPIYQRRYCWTPQMVTRLLSDVHDACKERAPYHPLGTIVLAPQQNSKRVLDIVDGQQRLTTMILLLSVFRHFAPPNQKQVYTKWIKSAVPKDYFTYRLNLAAPYHQAFCDHFLDPADLEEHLDKDYELAVPDRDARPVVELLSENVRELAGILENMERESREKLAHYFYKRCRFLVIYTHDVDSAYRIFTSLNVPGVPLTPVDYLKAVTFGKLKASVGDGYELKVGQWVKAEKQLGNTANFSELLDHLYRIEMAGTAQKSSFLLSFSASLGNTNSPYHRYMFDTLTPGILIDKIKTHSVLWRSIMEPSRTALDWAQVRENKSRIHLKTTFDIGLLWRTWLTVALAAGKFNIKLLQQEEFWNRLEKLIAVLFVGYKQPRKGVDSLKEKLIIRFYDILKDIATARSDEMVCTALEPRPQEIKVFLTRINGNLYGGAGIFATQYILRRINAEMSSTKVAYDWEKVQIEHIYPQNPGRAWDKIDFQGNTNRLGNLCLLPASTNIQCSNAPWATKKDIYTENRKGEMVPFALTTMTLVKADQQWTCLEFEKRHAKLLKYIAEIYKVNPPATIGRRPRNAGASNSEEIEEDEDEEDEEDEERLNRTLPNDLANMTADDKYVPEEYSFNEADDGEDDGKDTDSKKRVCAARESDKKIKKKQKVASHRAPATLATQQLLCNKVCGDRQPCSREAKPGRKSCMQCHHVFVSGPRTDQPCPTRTYSGRKYCSVHKL
ncbi:uncharacterized protein SPPG_03059 [Spizellomyces punctatus DAOM BR117]|uniref:DUF262 domain-containing protein n=1 Tax=Spizellomyces punctatus (strain DAOM BR117) TaxID=645134 RepID=A0A0L0HMG9_SPIPD|nr:uncharacterized protein SPPG_03059 [Spizellomyces punctatus DAOM BR117]KND02606.1 hypothetical protein SPPG_03059 [Spizellomyces punctatus DAOM BR117]|eukprot:XP_016610645.1 hypothetical protein SPPG_03059 [Spizellomyces punctatus DAOM BR117]